MQCRPYHISCAQSQSMQPHAPIRDVGGEIDSEADRHADRNHRDQVQAHTPQRHVANDAWMALCELHSSANAPTSIEATLAATNTTSGGELMKNAVIVTMQHHVSSTLRHVFGRLCCCYEFVFLLLHTRPKSGRPIRVHRPLSTHCTRESARWQCVESPK